MTKEEVVNDNIRLIYSISKKFYNVSQNDLIQAGVIGVLKAYDNYINDGTTKFSTYARDYIYGEMYSCVNKNKDFKISRDYLKLYKLLLKTKYELAQKLNRIPTTIELARFLDKDISLVEDVLLSGEAIMSLDSASDDDRSMYETVTDNSMDNVNEMIDLNDSLNCLTQQEKNIIRARYFKDMTQSEVAKKLNLTQVMVSRYEKKGIEKMRLYMMV